MPLDDLFDRQKREIEDVLNRFAKTTDFPYRTDPDIFDMKNAALRELQNKHEIEIESAKKNFGEDNLIKKLW